MIDNCYGAYPFRYRHIPRPRGGVNQNTGKNASGPAHTGRQPPRVAKLSKQLAILRSRDRSGKENLPFQIEPPLQQQHHPCGGCQSIRVRVIVWQHQDSPAGRKNLFQSCKEFGGLICRFAQHDIISPQQPDNGKPCSGLASIGICRHKWGAK